MCHSNRAHLYIVAGNNLYYEQELKNYVGCNINCECMWFLSKLEFEDTNWIFLIFQDLAIIIMTHIKICNDHMICSISFLALPLISPISSIDWELFASVMKKKRMSQECINPVIDVKVNVKTTSQFSNIYWLLKDLTGYEKKIIETKIWRAMPSSMTFGWYEY